MLGGCWVDVGWMLLGNCGCIVREWGLWVVGRKSLRR